MQVCPLMVSGKSQAITGAKELNLSIYVIAVIFVIFTCSCSGSTGRNQAQSPVASPTGTPGSAVPQLPAPSELLQQRSANREVSFTEDDLIRHGAEFDPAITPQHAADNGNLMEFTPSWVAGTGTSADLAYCLYRFSVVGYDRDAEVRYVWGTAPVDLSTAWIGMANFTNNKWDWYQAGASGLLALPGMADYTSGTDELLLVFVHASSDTPALSVVRLGSHPLDAVIRALPDQGIAPLDVDFDRIGSSFVGSIVNHEWDFDNDGTYEFDTDDTSQASHTYTDAGNYIAGIRLTDEFGFTATATVDIAAIEHWEHTWGAPITDRYDAVCSNGTDAIYTCGSKYDFQDVNTHLLLQKYSLAGELLWGRTWSTAGNQYGRDVVMGPDGGVYCVGRINSIGAGGSDMLVQKWDESGNLVWSKTWGGSLEETGPSLIVFRNNIYVAGKTTSFDDPDGDVFLVKYDLDGVKQWSVTAGGTDEEIANDLAGSYTFVGGATGIHLTGSTSSFGSPDSDVFHAKFNDAGSLSLFQTWRGGATLSGESIVNVGILSPNIFIGGQTDIGASNFDILLLEASTEAGFLAKTWGGADTDHCYAISWNGESLMLAGDSMSFGDGVTGLLAEITVTGALLQAEMFDSTEDITFFGADRFPYNGTLLAGHGTHAHGFWSAVVGTMADATGDWTTRAVSPNSHDGVQATANGIIDETPFGVIDDGAGFNDGLLLAH